MALSVHETRFRLFGDADLNPEQVKRLPPSVVQRVLKAIDRKYSLSPGYNRVKARVEAISYPKGSNDDRLQKALKRARDAAFTFAPEACRTQKPPLVGTPILLTSKAPRRWYHRIGESNLDPIGDLNSFGRNVLNAAGQLAKVTAFSGVYGGIGNMHTAAKMFRQGRKDFVKACECKDSTGIKGALWTLGLGANFTVIGGAMFADYLPAMIHALPSTLGNIVSFHPLALIFEKFPDMLQILHYAGPLALIGMSLCFFGSVYTGWDEVSEFKEGITTIVNGPESLERKALMGLEFLHDQLALSKTELEEIGNDSKAIDRKRKAKWSTFVRVVGEDAARRVAKELAGAMQGVREGNAGALQTAVELIQLVDVESKKARLKQKLLLMLGVIYLVLGILAFTTPAGPAIALLFALGALFWLTVDSQAVFNALAKKFCKPHEWPKATYADAKEAIASDLQNGLKLSFNGESIADIQTLLNKIPHEKAEALLNKLNQNALPRNRYDAQIGNLRPKKTDPIRVEATLDSVKWIFNGKKRRVPAEEIQETIESDLHMGVKFRIDGEEIGDYQTLVNRVPKQEDRLELNQGILEEAINRFSDEVLVGLSGENEPAAIDVTVDGIAAKKVFRLFEPLKRDIIHTYEVGVEADGSHYFTKL